MDNETDGRNLTTWVNERLQSLESESEWRPDVERGLAQFQGKKRNTSLLRRGWFARAATVSVVGLVLVVVASNRATVRQFWVHLSEADEKPIATNPAPPAETDSVRPTENVARPSATETEIRPSAQEEVTLPEIIYRVEPQYTEEARAAQIEGTVVLRGTIKKDGTIIIEAVLRSLGYGLDESATSALEQWRFKPASRNGEPIDDTRNIEVNFNLKK